MPGPVPWPSLQRPLGLAVTADSIYVGDNALRRVLRFRNAPGYPFVGEALGYEGPVAALGIAANGDVLVHTGVDLAPITLTAAGAFATTGLLSSKALHAGAGSVAWHSLHATIGDLPARAHIQFYFRSSDNPAAVRSHRPAGPPRRAMSRISTSAACPRVSSGSSPPSRATAGSPVAHGTESAI